MEDSIIINPIGVIRSIITSSKDEAWADQQAKIIIDQTQFPPESLLGLDEFSHLEVVFYFHTISVDKAIQFSRHPRGNLAWPITGIFAQRAKNRPNRIGISRCKIVKIEGNELSVSGLDAFDGSPVLDIKPYVNEFGPKGKVQQPKWITELMSDYY